MSIPLSALNNLTSSAANTASGVARDSKLVFQRHTTGRIEAIDLIKVQIDPTQQRFRDAEHAADFVCAAVDVYEALLQLADDTPENAVARLEIARESLRGYVLVRLKS